MELVLLHAFPLHSGLWSDVVDQLALESDRVLTPDFRGFGTAPLAGTDGVPTPGLEVLARDVLVEMDARGFDRPTVAGCSLGGYVAMALLRLAPERVGRIVLVDTKATADTDAARENRLRIAADLESGGDLSAFATTMVSLLLGPVTQERSPELVERVRGWIESADPAAIAWVQRAMAVRPDSHADLAAYPGPAAIVWGEDDAMAGWAEQESMLAALADRSDGRFVSPGAARGPAQFHRLAGVGHLTPLEAVAEVADALRG